MSKVVLFEPFDTDFGGHYFEHSATHIRFLKEKGHEPVFILGGNRTYKLEEFLRSSKVEYYKIGIPVYKARSKLPPPVKIPLNFLMETLRLIKLIKSAQRENVSLISILTFGVYEPLQLLLAVSYTNCKIPIIITMHTLTIEENPSLNPKKILNHFLSFFHFIFLRHLIRKDVVKKLVFYSDAARDFYLKRVTKKITRVLHPTYFDFNSFNYTREYSRELLQLPKDMPLLLLFNPDTKGKHIDSLIKSLQSVNEDFKLLIVGYMSPSFETNLKRLVEENKATEKVIIRNGFVEADKKYHYINATDLTLLPYRDTYAKARASSSFFVESIMLKKPVIMTTGVIETDRIINENHLGLIVNNTPEEWANSIHQFLKNFNQFKKNAEENAPKIRDMFLYSNTLDKVYDNNTLV